MNIVVKARYVFEVSADEMGLILRALEKIGKPGEELREEILNLQRPHLEHLISKFQTHINAIAYTEGAR